MMLTSVTFRRPEDSDLSWMMPVVPRRGEHVVLANVEYRIETVVWTMAYSATLEVTPIEERS